MPDAMSLDLRAIRRAAREVGDRLYVQLDVVTGEVEVLRRALERMRGTTLSAEARAIVEGLLNGL